MKKYRLALQIHNKGGTPLMLRWQQNGKTNTIDVPSSSLVNRDIKVKSVAQPPPIEFQVFTKDINELGQINGQDTFSVQPRLTGFYRHLDVTSGKFFFPVLLFFVCDDL